MAEQTWRSFPLDIYVAENGDKFILPTNRDSYAMRETIRRLEGEIAATSDESRKKTLQETLKRTQEHVDSTLSVADKLREKATRKNYSVREPSFGEYLHAEEQSKDFIVGEPRVDQSQLSLRLMANRVKLDDRILGETEVGEIEYSEAQKLYNEICVMLYPNNDRLPFLK